METIASNLAAEIVRGSRGAIHGAEAADGIMNGRRNRPWPQSRQKHESQGESRVVIRDVGWQGYQTLLTLVGDQPVRNHL